MSVIKLGEVNVPCKKNHTTLFIFVDQVKEGLFTRPLKALSKKPAIRYNLYAASNKSDISITILNELVFQPLKLSLTESVLRVRIELKSYINKNYMYLYSILS